MRDIDGITYMHDGDWVKSCTATAEHHDGRWEIIAFKMPVPTAKTRQTKKARLTRAPNMPTIR